MGAGEDPQDCARRELREEVGLEVDDLVALGVLQETLSGSPHTSHVFTIEASQMPRPDRREIIEARFFSADALPDLLTRNVPKRLDMWRAHKRES